MSISVPFQTNRGRNYKRESYTLIKKIFTISLFLHLHLQCLSMKRYLLHRLLRPRSNCFYSFSYPFTAERNKNGCKFETTYISLTITKKFLKKCTYLSWINYVNIHPWKWQLRSFAAFPRLSVGAKYPVPTSILSYFFMVN